MHRWPHDLPARAEKLKIKGNVVVTANRLTDGAVVYRTVDGEWTTELGLAAVVNNAPAATEMLRAAEADDVRAVGPYVAPVDLAADQPHAAGQPARTHPRCRSDDRAARRARLRPTMYVYDDYDWALPEGARRRIPRPGAPAACPAN